MALTFQQKEQLVKEYGERLGKAQVVVWANYSGLSVAQLMPLRRQLQDSGAETIVVKNTLMRIALEQAGIEVGPELSNGPCLVSFVYEDIAPATKSVVDFARLNADAYQIIGGLVGSKPATVAQISGLRMLPSREVLLGQVVGGFQAPISGFVIVLSGVLRSLLNVLNARSEQLESAPA